MSRRASKLRDAPAAPQEKPTKLGLVLKIISSHVRLSLRTADPGEARARSALLSARFAIVMGLRDTRAAILEGVVAAYADLLYDQEAVAIATADLALLQHQIAEAQARFKLGTSTLTDVARLQAQYAGA